MSDKTSGRIGEILRFGLGSRNWILAHMKGTDEQFTWTPPEGGRSAKDVVDHVSWVIQAVCQQLSNTLGVEFEISEPEQFEDTVAQLEEDVNSAYNSFRKLCEQMTDEMLDTVTTLPPPARLREGSVETILRIMTGYHVVHHSGQLAVLLRRAKD
ncbi:MAG: DinB family protein [Candidatus Thorarchaeota archaeon]|nr:DinB family protein [Candidatus Thorarchaeota archaeon]